METSQQILLTPRASPVGRLKVPQVAHSRVKLVETLIFTATSLLLLSWPHYDTERLRFFFREILKRSKSSYRVVQLALFYVARLSPAADQDEAVFRCPKRLFLTCLILASKFLQDNNYKLKSWSTVTGLSTQELVHNEMVVLKALDYRLNMSGELYHLWASFLYKLSTLACAEPELVTPLSPASPIDSGFLPPKPQDTDPRGEHINELATSVDLTELAQLLYAFKRRHLASAGFTGVTSDATRKRKLDPNDDATNDMKKTCPHMELSVRL